jgi:hypothetical protein
MSLLRPIIRITALAALRQNTWSEARVYDSDLTPLVDAVLGQKDAQGNDVSKTYMVIYTDADDIENADSQLYSGMNRKLTLTLEIGVAGAVKNPSDQNKVVIKFARTDAGMEFACDVIEAQAIAALIGAPRNEWGNLFKKFVPKVTRVQRRRGGSAEGGTKWAARRVQLTCTPMYDLLPGVVPPESHPVRTFIALAATHSDQTIKNAAAVIAKFVETDALPEWRVAQGYLGMTIDGARAVQVPGLPLPYPNVETPPLDYSDAEDEFPPEFGEVTLSDDPPLQE